MRLSIKVVASVVPLLCGVCAFAQDGAPVPSGDTDGQAIARPADTESAAEPVVSGEPTTIAEYLAQKQYEAEQQPAAP